MKGRYYAPFLKPDNRSPVTRREMQIFRKELKSCRQAVVKIFMDAVDQHDGKTIIELANAVWFFKDKRKGELPTADRQRFLLVSLKAKLAGSGEKYTIRDIAKFLFLEGVKEAYSKDAQADGFSALRRKCKRLGVPIHPSRKIKKK